MSGGTLLLLVSMMLGLIGGHLLKKYDCRVMQEANLSVAIGLLLGGLLWLIGEGSRFDSITRMNADIFFLIILPPILFDGTYNSSRVRYIQKLIWNSIGTILSLGIIGSVVNILTISCVFYGFSDFLDLPITYRESVVFGVIISCTDPVTLLSFIKDSSIDD